jgi:hypothetical protein
MAAGTDLYQAGAAGVRRIVRLFPRWRIRCAWLLCALSTTLAASGIASAQLASISTWDAAEFRIWGFVPYWVSSSELNAFPVDGVYKHVSDVLYFGGVRPRIDGTLYYASGATTELATLKSHAASNGFRLHMSMFEVYDPASGNDVDTVWNTIGASPSLRATFVNNVKNLLVANNMTGFNFDYERPNTDSEWANYTQLAKDMRAVINPLGMEISVDDYGSTDSDWDNTAVFDAATYDQLFIMGYHYGATSNNTFANGKLALTAQGADKAFKNEQLVLGVGTWGSGPSTKTLKSIVAADPDLAYNAGTWSDGTNTWTIESREQVRAKTQLALDRNMPGMMTWTLHYDATNNLSLHRVMHHYAVFQRGIPDLNLDGKVNAADANELANNMGTVPGWTGTNTAARFDDFYLSGNWEKGDRDGNGFVNQQDADWLAGRYADLGVNLPDRLAYSGTFENFQDSRGLTGRWQAKREAAGNLRETGNYTQHGTGGLTWSGAGVGAAIRSNYSITIRNQNAAEAYDGINTLPRMLSAELATPIDLSQNTETYFTFLVRSNTSGLSSSQVSSPNRMLALEFLDADGVNQFDFAFRGMQQQFAIQSQADAAGQDVSASGFLPNTTCLVVGQIAGNGAAANTLRAAVFAGGSTVGNFASAGFPWALTAQSSAGFNPVITQLQFSSLYEGSYTVSNVWIGSAADFFATPSAAAGDYNADGVVDTGDFLVWMKTKNQTGALLPADGDGDGTVDDGDYFVWQQNFGRVLNTGSGSIAASSHATVPEPHAFVPLLLVAIMGFIVIRR